MALPSQQDQGNERFSWDLKSYEFYSKQVEARDIFTSPARTADAPAGVKEDVPAGQLPGHLKVVGLILGDNPQVIIEDGNAHQTYFITPDKPEGGISLQSSTKDKMILNYKSQNIIINVKGNQGNGSKTAS